MNRISFSLALVLMLSAMISKAKKKEGVNPLRRRVLGETPMSDPTWFCIHRLKADKSWKHIRSPGFPKSIKMKHSRCTWKIAAAGNYRIRLAFRIISLAADDPEHCSTNYIEVIDETLGKSQGRLCGRKTNGDIVSQGNKVRLDLQLDPSEVLQRGFSISFSATKAKSGFYPMKSFIEKPLPSLRPPKIKEKPKPVAKSKPKGKPKSPTFASSGKKMLSSDGKLVIISDDTLINPSGHMQYGGNNNADREFKPLSGEDSAVTGMSTLMIVGISIGAVLVLFMIAIIARKVVVDKRKKKKEGPVCDKPGDTIQFEFMKHERALETKKSILSPHCLIVSKPEIRDIAIPEKINEYRYQEDELPPRMPENDLPPLPVIHSGVHSMQHPHKVDKTRMNGIRNESFVGNSNRAATEQKRHRLPSNRKISQMAAKSNHQKQQHPHHHHQQQKFNLADKNRAPFRYSSKKKNNYDTKGAIEALNNEVFCGSNAVETQPEYFKKETRVVPMDSNRRSSQRERQPSNIAHGTNDIDRRQSLLLPRERNVRGHEPTDVHSNLQNYRRRSIHTRQGNGRRESTASLSRRETLAKGGDGQRMSVNYSTQKSQPVEVMDDEYHETIPDCLSLPRHVVPASRS